MVMSLPLVMLTLPSALAFQLVWQAQSPLPEPRAALLHAVVGSRLLAAGGTLWKEGRKIWSRRCDLFDPVTNSWSAGPPLPMPRADSAVVEAGGEFLFLGGTSEGRALDDVLVFNGTGWRSRPEMRLPGPSSYAQAALVGRRIYLFGGLEKTGDIASARRDVWMWNLDAPRNGWLLVSQMPEPARSNYAFAVLGGKAYIFGGVTSTGEGFRNLSDSWSYDFNSNAWLSLPSVPNATRAWSAAVWQGAILLLGGYTEQFESNVLSYSPRSRSFTYSGSLPRGLADVSVLAIDKDIYVTGGESGAKIRSGETWRTLR
jgi:N-acetylneuraminic acid mutarotase